MSTYAYAWFALILRFCGGHCWDTQVGPQLPRGRQQEPRPRASLGDAGMGAGGGFRTGGGHQRVSCQLQERVLSSPLSIPCAGPATLLRFFRCSSTAFPRCEVSALPIFGLWIFHVVNFRRHEYSPP